MKKILNPGLVIILATVIFITCKKNPPDIPPQPIPNISSPKPIANAGNDTTIRLPLDSLRLDGTLSYDPGGTTLSYSWRIITGPGNGTLRTPDCASTLLVNLKPDFTIIELEVTNKAGKGTSAKDTVKIYVLNAVSPQVSAGINQVVYLPTSKFTLNGSSNLIPNEIQKIEWHKITGPPCNIESPNTLRTEVSQFQEGNYQFGLAITTKSSVVYKDTCKVSVVAPGTPYVSIEPRYILTSLPDIFITLKGRVSFGSGNPTSATKIEWNKISGPTSYNIEALFATSTRISNLSEGLYEFEYRVTFDNGTTGNAISTVAVTNPASPNHEVILENRQWDELPWGLYYGYLHINLKEYIPTGTPIKQVFIKPDCLGEWLEIFTTDLVLDYTYLVSDGKLVISWGGDGCNIPNDTPDIKIVY